MHANLRRVALSWIVIASGCFAPLAAGQSPPPAAPPTAPPPASPPVSTPAAPVEPELSPQMKMLQALGYTRMTFDFRETRAEEAWDRFREALGANLIVRYLDHRTGANGIDPDTPITLSVENRRAIDVIEMLVEQCAVTEECTWQLRRGFIEVGTKDRLSVGQARETRLYPISDILQEAPDFENAPTFRLEDELAGGWLVNPYRRGWWGRPIDPSYYGRFSSGTGFGGTAFAVGRGSRPARSPQEEARSAQELIEVIILVIEPDAWEQNGGEWATITYRDGSLVVRAPDYIHRQIGGYPPVPPPPVKKQPTEEPATKDGG